MKTITIKTLGELENAAKELLNNYKSDKIFAFYGKMGAGKTTFIKSICKHLGVPNIVNSPTFSLINEYKNNLDEKIYHFDFYRIEKTTEAYDLGYEDYFYGGHYCFIEWPEKIHELLPENTIKVNIQVKNEIRTITIN